MITATYTIFGREYTQPNTFIGGVSATVNTASALATKLGISSSRVSAFSVVGSDIQAHISGTYTLPSSVFVSNTAITYYDDSLAGNCISLGSTDAFYGATNLVWVKFPVATYAGYRTFRQCTSLTTITFGSMLTLSSECFTNCSALVNLNSSFSTVTSLGNWCFYGCSSITNLQLPNVGLCSTNNATSMFFGMISLTTLYAPNLHFPSGSAYGVSMCSGCTALVNVTLTSLNQVSTSYFINCTSLVTLSLPSVTTAYLATTFQGTTSLTTLDWPSLTSISGSSGYRAFYQSAVQNLNFHAVTTLSSLVNDVFESTSGLLTLDIRNVTSTIGSTAANQNVFRLIKTGVTIYAHSSQQTINAGAPEGDLAYAITSRSATVNYI